MRILVLNGPNLGRLGSREPDVYGTATIADIQPLVEAAGAADAPIEADVRQTDDEAELVGWIHEAVDARTPVILNPAAFTHYSYALRDACAQLQGVAPLVEVHISNPHAREAFRHTSVVSGVATGVIAGFGLDGYRLAGLAVVARMRGQRTNQAAGRQSDEPARVTPMLVDPRDVVIEHHFAKFRVWVTEPAGGVSVWEFASESFDDVRAWAAARSGRYSIALVTPRFEGVEALWLVGQDPNDPHGGEQLL